MSKDYDQISRDRIRSDIHSNFFVEAGAGSGKTSALVDRMVAMVEGGIDIRKICAITFTKAAAGEFYSRFQEKLAKSDSENARKALRDIDLCFMGTIDSFCNMVLSEHPAAAKIPSDSVVVSDEELSALYKREYSKILSGDRGTEIKEKAERFSRYTYGPQEVFFIGMKMLTDIKNTHLNFTPPREGEPDEVFKAERQRMIPVLGYLAEHEEVLLTNESKAAAAARSLIYDISRIRGSWNYSLSAVKDALSRIKALRLVPEFDIERLGPGWDKIFVKHGLKKDGTFGKNGHYKIIDDKDVDPLSVKAIEDQIASVATDFLSSCMKVVSEQLKKEGKLTFSDYLILLRDVLKKDAAKGGKLIKHIFERHSYFLIDEFQDTNPVQAEIFFYLTAKEPKENWKECRPKPGSLFIVGDPKQSIYRFRNADVSSFLRVKKLFEDPEVGEVLTLQRNFRSTNKLCGWFNTVFSKLLPEDTEIQSGFREIPIEGQEQWESPVSGAYSYEVPYDQRTVEDPEKVKDVILKIINHPDIPINDFSDFMIITPTKTGMDRYMNALSSAGIPFRIEGKVLFDQCEPLKSISYLMSAAADPYDRGAAFAAKHLSGCRIGDNAIKQYARRAMGMSPAAVFSMLLEEERVFARAGTHNAEYVYFALELLRSAELDGTVSTVKEGAAFISRLINEKSEAERCVQLRRDSNCVHIANLHKVKGLQAPVVILAGSARKKTDAYMRVDYAQDPPESYVFVYKDNSSRSPALATTVFSDEKEKETDVLEAEALRLLYVAATRAEKILIVSSTVKNDGSLYETQWKPLARFADKDIFEILGDVEIPEPPAKKESDADSLYDEAEASTVLMNDEPWEPSYTIKKPSKVEIKRVTSSENDYEDKSTEEIEKEQDLSSSLGAKGRIIGTLVHRLMEMLVSSRNAMDLSGLVTEIIKDYGVEEDVYRDLLMHVGETIRSGGYPQDNGAPQDILKALLSADEVHCELPFCFKDEDEIWHGVIDVVYRQGESWHIIDYKTNAESTGLDDKYKEQLDSYIRALDVLAGVTADALIYHIDV